MNDVYYGEQRTMLTLQSLICAALPLKKFNFETTMEDKPAIWVSQHALQSGKQTGKWPSIVDFPIETGDFPVRYVSQYQRIPAASPQNLAFGTDLELSQELESDVPRESSWWLAIDSHHLPSGSNLHGDFCISPWTEMAAAILDHGEKERQFLDMIYVYVLTHQGIVACIDIPNVPH